MVLLIYTYKEHIETQRSIGDHTQGLIVLEDGTDENHSNEYMERVQEEVVEEYENGIHCILLFLSCC